MTVKRRRSEDGSFLCNACGLYKKLKGKDRPYGSMRNADDRQRRPSVREEPQQKTYDYYSAHIDHHLRDQSRFVASAPPDNPLKEALAGRRSLFESSDTSNHHHSTSQSAVTFRQFSAVDRVSPQSNRNLRANSLL